MKNLLKLLIILTLSTAGTAFSSNVSGLEIVGCWVGMDKVGYKFFIPICYENNCDIRLWSETAIATGEKPEEYYYIKIYNSDEAKIREFALSNNAVVEQFNSDTLKCLSTPSPALFARLRAAFEVLTEEDDDRSEEETRF